MGVSVSACALRGRPVRRRRVCGGVCAGAKKTRTPKRRHTTTNKPQTTTDVRAKKKKKKMPTRNAQDSPEFAAGLKRKKPEARLRYFAGKTAGRSFDDGSGAPQPRYKMDGMKIQVCCACCVLCCVLCMLCCACCVLCMLCAVRWAAPCATLRMALQARPTTKNTNNPKE